MFLFLNEKPKPLVRQKILTGRDAIFGRWEAGEFWVGAEP